MATSPPPDHELETPARPRIHRRVLRLVRIETDWKAALRESAIIILSVLAALAAQAWWQGRQDRERETDYLRQLLSDTRANEARLDQVIEYNGQAGAAAARAMSALLDRGPPPPADSVESWLGRAAETTELQPLAGTYRALIGTGDLRLLRNDSLRVLLSEFAGTLESETVRQRDIRDVLMNRAGDVARTMPFFRGAFVEHAPHEQLDIAAARRNPDLIAVVFTMQASSANSNGGLIRLREQLRRLHRALAAEPALRHP